jgi:hypothetical protein
MMMIIQLNKNLSTNNIEIILKTHYDNEEEEKMMILV